MIAHAVVHIGGHGADALFVKWIYNIVLLGSAGSCLARGLAIRRERAARLILGLSLLLWSAGNNVVTLTHPMQDSRAKRRFLELDRGACAIDPQLRLDVGHRSHGRHHPKSAALRARCSNVARCAVSTSQPLSAERGCVTEASHVDA
jgi:hypothetical protein